MPGAWNVSLDQRVLSSRSYALGAPALLGLAKPTQPVVGISPEPEPAVNPAPSPAAMPAASALCVGSGVATAHCSGSTTTRPEPPFVSHSTLAGVNPRALSAATWYLFCSAPLANAAQSTPRLSTADVPPPAETVAVTSGVADPGQS